MATPEVDLQAFSNVDAWLNDAEARRIGAVVEALGSDDVRVILEDLRERIGATGDGSRCWDLLSFAVQNDRKKLLVIAEHVARLSTTLPELAAAAQRADGDLDSAFLVLAGATVRGSGSLRNISNTRNWTDGEIEEQTEHVKAKLDWENTTGSARKWWDAFEGENRHRRALVVRVAEELANRKATITEYFLAYVYSQTDNIQANLHYLDYARLKSWEEKKRKATTQGETVTEKPAASKDSSRQRPAPDARPTIAFPPGTTDTSEWTKEEIRAKLTQVRARLDWDNSIGIAQRWWGAFERQNDPRPDLVLLLAEELAKRKATVVEFFLAYDESGTDNIQANLHYLDYSRLRKEEEGTKKLAEQRRAVQRVKELFPEGGVDPLPELSEADLALVKMAPGDEFPPEVRQQLDLAIAAADAQFTEPNNREEAQRLADQILENLDVSASAIGRAGVALVKRYPPEGLSSVQLDELALWLFEAERHFEQADRMLEEIAPQLEGDGPLPELSGSQVELITDADPGRLSPTATERLSSALKLARAHERYRPPKHPS